MLEPAESKTQYAVEVQYKDDDQPDYWEVRFGWFDEIPRFKGDEPGLERAKHNYRYAKSQPDFVSARIVKRVISVEVLTDID